MKIAISKSYGGFYLSKEAYEFLGLKWDGIGGICANDRLYLRTDANVVECIETLGDSAANCKGTKLAVIEIPDDVDWTILNYDGIETVVDVNRMWN